jgi:hypothetical protein
MMREPRKLLAHLEGKLTQHEEELLRLMRAWAEGASEVSEEEIRARLREVPLPRWDLLEAVIRVRTIAVVQASRRRQWIYEAVAAGLREILERLRRGTR